MDVVDPTLGSGCVTSTIPGINWVPIRTATNGAFGSAIARWMIENDRCNTEYLSFPNYDAAYDGGYASFTNASHLVVIDESSDSYRKFLTPEQAELEVPETEEGKTAPTYYVVIDSKTGEPTLDTDSTSAEIEYEGTVGDLKVCTAYVIMKNAVMEHSMEEYAEITGIELSEIERIANEFSSHGVKASANGMGGTALSNGTASNYAMHILNALIGSNQMTGGSAPRRVTAKTSADGERYLLSTIEGKPSVSTKNATHISRTGRQWNETDEYAARVDAGEEDPKPLLPWFASSTVSDNQALTSVINQYPYQCKILFSWMSNVIEATPGALRDEVIERLEDPSVVPLFISCDVTMGEMTQMADYIVPDTTPFESFGVVTQEGYWPGRGNAVRWRVVTPQTVKLDDGRYASYEAFICDVARACDMPGFGDDAISATDGSTWSFNDAPDFFLKSIANLAYDTDPVDDIDEDEAKMQGLDELPEEWKSAVSEEEWPKVLHVLSRGGRFWPIELNQGEGGRSGFAKSFKTFLYNELPGAVKNPFSGEYSSGTLRHDPERFGDGTAISDLFSADEYPFAATNYKARFRSVSMQANNPIMRDLCAHNYLELNRDDAAELGIADGDQIRITSATGEVMEGPAMVRAGIAPKTFAVAYGYGHRAFGSRDYEIDGTVKQGDPAIGAGIHLQMMTDPTLGDALAFLADNDAAAPGRNGGMYKIEKA